MSENPALSDPSTGSLANDDAAARVEMDYEIAGANSDDMKDLTLKEIVLAESLLTPGLQTSVKFDSYIHNRPVKDFDRFKGKALNIAMVRPILAKYGLPTTLTLSQTIYRLDGRSLIDNNVERFTLRACDPTQLNDAKTLVSKSWKCTPPSSVVDYVLDVCVGAAQKDVEFALFPKDYIAENIHPYQVISQMCDQAVSGNGLDPSFVHYMTYGRDAKGIHHFRSLAELVKQQPVMDYKFNEFSGGWVDPSTIMTYSFPCDFDLLSDALNGIDENGKNINTIMLFNPVLKSFSSLGVSTFGCGIGGGVVKHAISNQNSAQQQDSCPDYSNVALLNRQARMSLLDRDKIAIKLIVPFNPTLNAGKMINVNLYNKEDTKVVVKNYGSGQYLILHLVHHVVLGGMGTTTIDCVSSSVGKGVV
jgi:hypothetical protein